ncbi:hypothetical protein EJ05DRAFT_352012 [Pseudovirgaria hyperparasitica]|uniref:Uncharacterized protein n=1 Tax=Pseudovirgaria hyperparasitica TaxID=470096 RepID=A0A6A6W6G0_9PEZI|nr:uncharacterized protein EJ05DRAFT_352012 [Pseudovirgaria hyperparasitica]KAF2758462.1 hypothetical protein EJ05DRAFT_352012 [Pseudovirgaria hyperparasitica]
MSTPSQIPDGVSPGARKIDTRPAYIDPVPQHVVNRDFQNAINYTSQAGPSRNTPSRPPITCGSSRAGVESGSWPIENQPSVPVVIFPPTYPTSRRTLILRDTSSTSSPVDPIPSSYSPRNQDRSVATIQPVGNPGRYGDTLPRRQIQRVTSMPLITTSMSVGSAAGSRRSSTRPTGQPIYDTPRKPCVTRPRQKAKQRMIEPVPDHSDGESKAERCQSRRLSFQTESEGDDKEEVVDVDDDNFSDDGAASTPLTSLTTRKAEARNLSYSTDHEAPVPRQRGRPLTRASSCLTLRSGPSPLDAVLSQLPTTSIDMWYWILDLCNQIIYEFDSHDVTQSDYAIPKRTKKRAFKAYERAILKRDTARAQAEDLKNDVQTDIRRKVKPDEEVIRVYCYALHSCLRAAESAHDDLTGLDAKEAKAQERRDKEWQRENEQIVSRFENDARYEKNKKDRLDRHLTSWGFVLDKYPTFQIFWRVIRKGIFGK